MDLFTYLMAKKGHNTHKDLFSYLLGEGETGTLTHFEGTNLTINNTLSSRIKNIQLKGQASQDGTPTPDAPIPIKVVTGDNSIVIKSKNLFEESSEWNFIGSIGTGEFAGQFPRNTTGNRRTFFYLVKPNTKYTVSFTTPGDRLIIWEHYSIINPSDYTILNPIQLDNQLVDISSNIPTEYTFTTSGNAKIVAIYYSLNTLPTNLEIKQTQIYPISLGALELAKIGNQQDYIYGTPNNWYKKSFIQKIIINGDEAGWSYPSTNRFNLDNLFKDYLKSGGNITYISNYYEGFNQTSSNADFNTLVSTVNYGFNLSSTTQKNFTIRFKDTRFTTTTDFKTWLSTNNITVYYVLNTPTDTQITDTTLINQLNNLYNARTYEEQTNIYTTYEDGNEQMIISFDALIKN